MGRFVETAATRAADPLLRGREQRLSVALRAGRMGTFVWDVATGSLDADAAHRRIWGFAPDEPLTDGTPVYSRIHPDDLEQVRTREAEALRTGHLENQFRIVWPDGTVRWIEVYADVLFEAGVPRQMVGVNYDVTARREADRRGGEFHSRAARQLAELDAIYAMAPIGLCVLDCELRFQRINARLAEINGLPVEVHLGRTVREVLPGLADEAEPLLRSVLETGEPLLDVEIVGETAARPGVPRTWKESFYPMRDGAGAVIGINVVAEEITEYKRLERERREEEAKLRVALANPAIVLTLCDTERRYLWIHDPAREFGRYSMLGRRDEELSSHPGTLRLAELKQSVVDTGRECRETLWFNLPHGERCYDAILSPVFDPGTGRVSGVSTTALDVTDRVRAQAALAEREAQFRTLAASLPCFLFLADASGRNTYVNELFRRYTGQPPTAPVMNHAAVHPDDQARVAAVWREAVARGETYEAELRIRRHDGEYRWFLARGAPVRNETGAVTGWCAACIDIDDVRRARATLQEASLRKDEFLATLAHELRNPLAPLRTAAYVLRSPTVPERERGVAREMIERQVTTLTRLVDDLLDVSRLTLGRIQLHPAPVDLAVALDQALEAAGPAIEDRGHRLHVAVPRGALWVDGDVVRLAQVYTNLLTNAAKYTPPGGEIALEATLRGTEAVVCVRDTGIGIARERLAEIFEMFAQAPAGRAMAQGGLGIGLALVKRLVEMHGGGVSVDSGGEGKGSEFCVRLPTCRPPVAAVQPTASSSSGARGSRVLVVDDNVDAAESLALLLSNDGHEVALAHSAARALEAVAEGCFDAAILDIGLPDFDGYELARRIRAHHPGQVGTLVALTGWGQERDRERAADAGFDRHFTKPVDPDQLLAML